MPKGIEGSLPEPEQSVRPAVASIQEALLTDTLPIRQTHEFVDPGVVLSIESDERRPVFYGLRKYIATRRQERALANSNEHFTSAVVKKEAVAAVFEGRFPALQPVTRAEQRAALRASKQRDKLIAHSYAGRLLQSAYGHENEVGKKVRPTSDLSTPDQDTRLAEGRYTNSRRRSERKFARRFKGHEASADRIRTLFESSAEGASTAVRSNKAKSAENLNKAVRLSAHIDRLDTQAQDAREAKLRRERLEEESKQRQARQKRDAKTQKKSRRTNQHQQRIAEHREKVETERFTRHLNNKR